MPEVETEQTSETSDKPTEKLAKIVDAQGCILIDLEGQEYTLRPSFRAIQSIEHQTGRSLFDLANFSVNGCLMLADMTTIVVEMWRAYGATLDNSDPLVSTYRSPNTDKVARLLFERGMPSVNARLSLVLLGALSGGYNSEGEPKATGTNG